jgi:UDPglucose 6-dehydrogenase
MEYREIDPATLAGVVSQKNIIDARNKLDVSLWRSAGWNIRALGRPTA